ncbi:hypothetical protein HY772_06730 [Candidatus Woesearchaeota archaeon]|nr:hypothetical protein [Candidatus Woesearchaeota archaeon]
MKYVLLIISIIYLLIMIRWYILYKKEIRSRFHDKKFKSETWIAGIFTSLFLFFFSYAITIILLDPLFTPQIKLDYSCEYRSYHGEFDLEIKNDGEVGEEGFSLVVNDIILKNFSVNPTGNQKVIYMETKKRIPAYSIDETWANDLCSVSFSHPILESDPRPNKTIPKTDNAYLKLKCTYFPPNSKFNFHFNSLGDNRNINYEYWGKDTQPKKEINRCEEAVCYGNIKDFLLNLFFKITGRWEIRQCTKGDYTRSFG